MNTAVMEVLAGIGFGTVCAGIIVIFAGLSVLIKDYLIQKRMEKKSK